MVNVSECLETKSADPIKILAFAVLVIPALSYALITSPQQAGWAVLYLGILYLSILFIIDNPPTWFMIGLSIIVAITNYLVIFKIPTRKTILPLVIIEANHVNHVTVSSTYTTINPDIGQIFILIESIKLVIKCKRLKSIGNNNYKPGTESTINTLEAAVV